MPDDASASDSANHLKKTPIHQLCSDLDAWTAAFQDIVLVRPHIIHPDVGRLVVTQGQS